MQKKQRKWLENTEQFYKKKACVGVKGLGESTHGLLTLSRGRDWSRSSSKSVWCHRSAGRCGGWLPRPPLGQRAAEPCWHGLSGSPALSTTVV